MKNKIYFISEALSIVFNKKDILQIPKKLNNKKITLIKVNDKKKFLKNCKVESKNFKIAGASRKKDWEKGWSGNGTIFDNELQFHIPYYFKKNDYVRIGKNIYEDISGYTEYYLLRCIQYLVFNKYFKLNTKTNNIIEFGCGTGHNIIFLRKYFKNINWYGADWAKSAINKLSKTNLLEKSNLKVVNFFDKKTYWKLDKKYYCFTNAALEQTGNKYKKFINFLFDDINCLGGIHIEPFQELLGNSEIEINSKKYANKRGYLKNFINFIKKNKKIKISKKKILIGSKYIYGYHVVFWLKKNA